MLRKLLKNWFGTGLTASESPSLFEVLVGLVGRCFWTFLFGALVSSFVWCVVCINWNQQTRDLIAEGFDGAAKSMTSDRKASIVFESPGRQAKHWLQKIENLDVADSLSANELMGAALVLDYPSQEYVSFEFAAATTKRAGQVDVFEILRKGLFEFERLCEDSCRSLAQRATEANPDDAELHRIRAVLLFNPDFDSPESPVLSDNWMQVLRDCYQRDPDNGLYDYLMAVECWRCSAELDFNGERETLNVKDKLLFELGLTHFHRAQQRPDLMFPTQESSLIRQFAKKAGCSQFAVVRVACESRIPTKSLQLTRHIGKMLLAQAGDYEADGDIDEAVTTYASMLHFAEQWNSQPWAMENWVRQWVRLCAWQRLNAIARVNPEQTARIQTPDERQLVFDTRFDRLKSARIQEAIASHAGIQGSKSEAGAQKIASACSLFVYGGFALAIAAGCHWLSVKQGLGKRFRINGWQQLVCFVLAIGLSAFFLGVVPAKIVSLDTARLTIVVTGFVFYVLAAGLLCRRWFFSQNHKPPINGLLMIPAMFVIGATWLAISFTTSQYFVGPDSTVDNLKASLSLPIPVALGGQKFPDWAKFLFEWFSNSGPSIGFVLGLLMSTLWCARLVVSGNQDNRRAKTLMLKSVIYSCVQPLLVAGCLFAIVSMYGLPSTLRNANAWHDYRELYCDNEKIQIAYDRAKAEVEADTPLMQQLSAEANASADRVVMQETW